MPPKVPIDQYAAIDLDATPIGAYAQRFKNGVRRYVFFCPHCDAMHRHGAAEGHREAHCTNPASPYLVTGYNLAYAGRWKQRP